MFFKLGYCFECFLKCFSLFLILLNCDVKVVARIVNVEIEIVARVDNFVFCNIKVVLVIVELEVFEILVGILGMDQLVFSNTKVA